MMKWSGWGDPQFVFPIEKKPKLLPFIAKKLELTFEAKTLPIDRERVRLPKSHVDPEFRNRIYASLKPDQICVDDEERLLHSYGKSYPDLVRVRRGEIRRAPDVVLLPESHEDVEQIVRIAHETRVCVIPFGGGTNIVGGIDPLEAPGRTVATVDLRRMNRLLSVDPESRTAVLQAGAVGPKLEKDLQAKGFSLGHFPDSFEYSTLGGWLATRSAGMQSDAYGKIEDMVVSLKMVTPTGTMVTRDVPAASAGPDLKQLIVGSEGVLGIITEATMRVHATPAVKDYRGFLFRSFEDGVRAIQECLDHGIKPSMIRLQDEGETELAFCMKAPKTGFAAMFQKGVMKWLKARGYQTPCIMIVGFEGERANTKHVSARAGKVIKSHGGFSLGGSVGKTWSADKFNMPYLRDYLMDYGCMVDVSETAATWTNLLPLYRAVIASVRRKFAAETPGYIGCHISHTYETGACLYFTYGTRQAAGQELRQYDSFKRLITDTIMAEGGTVSHHHAVGYEHRPWMEAEVGATGLLALRGLKKTLDPHAILNPGKLIPEPLVAISPAQVETNPAPEQELA